RTADAGGVDHAAELFFGGAGLGVEHFRGGANGAHADLDLDAEALGILADFPEIVGFETADEANFGEVDHLSFLRGAVIEELERGPVLRAETEQVDSELDRGSRRGGQGREGGEVQECASIHSYSQRNGEAGRPSLLNK